MVTFIKWTGCCKAENKSPDEYKVSKQADVLMTYYNLDESEINTILKEAGYSEHGLVSFLGVNRVACQTFALRPQAKANSPATPTPSKTAHDGSGTGAMPAADEPMLSP